MTLFTLRIIALLTITTIAAEIDKRTLRVPNLLCIIGWITGLALSGSAQGLIVRLIAFAGMFFVSAIPLMGMGDFKLWIAIMMIVGIVPSLVITFMACVIFIIIICIFNRTENRVIGKLFFARKDIANRAVMHNKKTYVFVPFYNVASIIWCIIALVFYNASGVFLC